MQHMTTQPPTDPSVAGNEAAQPQYQIHTYGVANGNGSSPLEHADSPASQAMEAVPLHQEQEANAGSAGNAGNAVDLTSPTFTAAARLRDLQNEIAALQVSMNLLLSNAMAFGICNM